jgi:hypothetical protein
MDGCAGQTPHEAQCQQIFFCLDLAAGKRRVEMQQQPMKG